jgi:hypothetical protein
MHIHTHPLTPYRTLILSQCLFLMYHSLTTFRRAQKSNCSQEESAILLASLVTLDLTKKSHTDKQTPGSHSTVRLHNFFPRCLVCKPKPPHLLDLSPSNHSTSYLILPLSTYISHTTRPTFLYLPDHLLKSIQPSPQEHPTVSRASDHPPLTTRQSPRDPSQRTNTTHPAPTTQP